MHESIFALSNYKNHWNLIHIYARRVNRGFGQPTSKNYTDQHLVLSTDKCLVLSPGHTPSSDGNNKSVPVLHISQPNVIKIYWNLQLQSQLTLVHYVVFMYLYFVPLVNSYDVGSVGPDWVLSEWVAGWPPFVTGHCSLA